MTAVSAVVWGFLQWVGAEDGLFVDREAELRDSLAFGIATLLIAVPAFVVHLILLSRRITRTTDTSVRVAIARMEEGMAWLTVVVAGVVGTFGVAMLVFGGVGSVFDLGALSRDGTAGALTATIVPALSLLMTFAFFFASPEFQRGRSLREGRDAMAQDAASGQVVHAPASPTMGSTSLPAARLAFCSACGRERPPGARFCAGCGVAFGDVTPA